MRDALELIGVIVVAAIAVVFGVCAMIVAMAAPFVAIGVGIGLAVKAAGWLIGL